MSILQDLVTQAQTLTLQLQIEKARKDPYYFLTTFCKTIDEHDPTSPYKLIPQKEYIRDLCDLFLTENLLAIEKSRQMLVSWVCMSLALWDTMFKEARRTIIMSKKEKDANAMLDRIKLIYDNLPEAMKSEYKVDPYTYLQMGWGKRHSVIQGVPQGPDQVRQYTASLVIMDEAAFQEQAEKTYDAIAPTLTGGHGGKFVAISTPNGKNWFYRCVRDEF